MFANMFSLLLLAVAAVVHAQQSTLVMNATGVSCDVRPVNRNTINCVEDLKGTDRLYYLINPANYLSECANECYRRRMEDGFECKAFVYRTQTFPNEDRRLTCSFYTCRNMESSPANGILAVTMKEDCFTSHAPTAAPSASPSAAPTRSPTTAQPTRSPEPPSSSPTRRPTKTPTRMPTNLPTTMSPASSNSPTFGIMTKEPTTNPPTYELPTPFPTLAPTLPTKQPTVRATGSPSTADGFVSPSGVPSWASYDSSMFKVVSVNPNLCMIARPQKGTFSMTYYAFGGTKIDCLKECQYDALCTGIMYSKTKDSCVKAVLLETTDDVNTVDDYEANWVAYVKATQPVPYYANFCGQFGRIGLCTDKNTQGECVWGNGIRGYNQNRYTDTSYCSRIKCTKGLLV